jgi:adenylate cyclase
MENRVALLVAPLLLLTLAFWGGAFGQYLLERERRREIRDLFASYVDPSVVEWILRHADGVNLEGQRIVATILDTDIEGFTSITERLDPAVLIAQLNEYFESITEAAIEAGGLHDKYVGDALMVIYGFPIGREDHALRAVMAAREILSRVERLNQDWERRGLPPLNTRIGICSGEVVIGNVGSSKRKTFTAMGDAANMASRLEGLNKRFGTRVILSESTARLLPPDIPLRDLGEVEVRGISKPIRLFNPTFDVRPGSHQGPAPPPA